MARDAVGFLAGGILAAVAAGLIFVAFFPLPKEHDPRNHTGEAFSMTILVMFLCGGFIGRRGFSAEASSDLLPSVIGTYIVSSVFLSSPAYRSAKLCRSLALHRQAS